MVWAIVLVAMVVMGIAAIAGTGRLGEMPEPVTDRPKPLLPDLPFGEDYLSRLRIPVLAHGYAVDQVDDLLTACAAGEAPVPSLGRARFDVVRRGYAMDAVDELIDRLIRDADSGGAPEGDTGSPGDLKMRDNGESLHDRRD
ncbi:MAG TPA: DivIVA domain-containing protein [Arachnia sp.]|nr:DivIVA domain-containing protein [Arachnia sp.]HMT85216.1 DivIVA domain-containing protein [Arachnia sp.]